MRATETPAHESWPRPVLLGGCPRPGARAEEAEDAEREQWHPGEARMARQSLLSKEIGMFLSHLILLDKTSGTYFDLAVANDDFDNDTFEKEEANIDDDEIFVGSEEDEIGEDEEDDGGQLEVNEEEVVVVVVEHGQYEMGGHKLDPFKILRIDFCTHPTR
ncbi:hypothetical protein BAE44_0021433 [Dichanthelium oligosanthes]|uniref:Uncharacterized protein n=1 Tax=Dichanthelium oligosanthes TaxID=888268 RepID=A0A1E5UXC8_9POAL|nr:hypothetical protein BAE44_0021433 [Dichanthelium oligosanthes]